MAKAIFGHVGLASDPRLLSEVRRLRERVRDLETEVALLHAENAALAGGRLADDEILTLSDSLGTGALADKREPAYT